MGDIIGVCAGRPGRERAARRWRSARSYGIRSEFGELKITRSNGYGPRESFAEGRLNGGGPLLHVHTAAGNIEIKRKPRP